MLIKKIVEFFKSLKLTVTLLAFAIVLVFVGTIAQADEGLYIAQQHYFRQWLVVGANFFGHKIPLILPGGYLIGTLLLVNLVVAHIYRFQLSTKKIGIMLAHSGVILLLVGQLATDMLARETQMHFAEGETRNFSDSATEYELIFISGNEATAIPNRLLRAGDELKIDSLPFAIRVKSFWENSDLNFRAPMLQNAPPLTTNGVARNFDFKKADDVKAMDQRNIPTAVLEFLAPSGPLGTWVASAWAGDPATVGDVRNSFASTGADMAQKITAQLTAPQTIEMNGKQFTFNMRPAQVRFPYSLTLLKATHTVYPGTVSEAEPEGIPKDFRSRVRIDNPQTGEKREVEISMNHPLRYGGYTYYQYQMDAGQTAQMAGRAPTSVLQVVRNPSWLTPYIGCAMVGLGLVIQFMYHLIGFISKRKTK
jgi:hypothetical protein